jgi:hypothetical protein
MLPMMVFVELYRLSDVQQLIVLYLAFSDPVMAEVGPASSQVSLVSLPSLRC